MSSDNLVAMQSSPHKGNDGAKRTLNDEQPAQPRSNDQRALNAQKRRKQYQLEKKSAAIAFRKDMNVNKNKIKQICWQDGCTCLRPHVADTDCAFEKKNMPCVLPKGQHPFCTTSHWKPYFDEGICPFRHTKLASFPVLTAVSHTNPSGPSQNASTAQSVSQSNIAANQTAQPVKTTSAWSKPLQWNASKPQTNKPSSSTTPDTTTSQDADAPSSTSVARVPFNRAPFDPTVRDRYSLFTATSSSSSSESSDDSKRQVARDKLAAINQSVAKAFSTTPVVVVAPQQPTPTLQSAPPAAQPAPQAVQPAAVIAVQPAVAAALAAQPAPAQPAQPALVVVAAAQPAAVQPALVQPAQPAAAQPVAVVQPAPIVNQPAAALAVNPLVVPVRAPIRHMDRPECLTIRFGVTNATHALLEEEYGLKFHRSNVQDMSHKHPRSAFSRALGEVYMFDYMRFTLNINNALDVGGNPNRHAMQGSEFKDSRQDYIHSCCPTIIDGDQIRLQKIKRNSAKYVDQAGVPTFCEHTMQTCSCHPPNAPLAPFDALWFVHSIYYVDPADIHDALSRTRTKTALSLHHMFPTVTGEFYNTGGVAESSWRTSFKTVKGKRVPWIDMQVIGNDDVYSHQNPLWLTSSSWTSPCGLKRLSIKTVRNIGHHTKFMIIAVDDTKIAPVKPVNPSLEQSLKDSEDWRNTFDFKSPVKNVELPNAVITSYGPLLLVSTDSKLVSIPKTMINHTATLLAIKLTPSTLLQSAYSMGKTHLYQQCNSLAPADKAVLGNTAEVVTVGAMVALEVAIRANSKAFATQDIDVKTAMSQYQDILQGSFTRWSRVLFLYRLICFVLTSFLVTVAALAFVAIGNYAGVICYLLSLFAQPNYQCQAVSNDTYYQAFARMWQPEHVVLSRYGPETFHWVLPTPRGNRVLSDLSEIIGIAPYYPTTRERFVNFVVEYVEYPFVVTTDFLSTCFWAAQQWLFDQIHHRTLHFVSTVYQHAYYLLSSAHKFTFLTFPQVIAEILLSLHLRVSLWCNSMVDYFYSVRNAALRHNAAHPFILPGANADESMEPTYYESDETYVSASLRIFLLFALFFTIIVYLIWRRRSRHTNFEFTMEHLSTRSVHTAVPFAPQDPESHLDYFCVGGKNPSDEHGAVQIAPSLAGTYPLLVAANNQNLHQAIANRYTFAKPTIDPRVSTDFLWFVESTLPVLFPKQTAFGVSLPLEPLTVDEYLTVCPPARRDALRTAAVSIASRDPAAMRTIAHIVGSSFIKQEHSALVTSTECFSKPGRVVTTFPNEVLLLTGCVDKAVHKYLMSAWSRTEDNPTPPIVYTPGTQPHSWGDYHYTHYFRGDRIDESDKSSFDGSCNALTNAVEKMVYQYLFNGSADAERTWAYYNSSWERHALGASASQYYGIKFMCPYTRPSGASYTTCRNTLVNGLINLYSWVRATNSVLPGQLFYTDPSKPVRGMHFATMPAPFSCTILVAGDDTLVYYPQFNTEHASAQAGALSAQLGFVCKIEPNRTYNTATFCSNSFTFVHKFVRGTTQPTFAVTPMVSKQAKASWLIKPPTFLPCEVVLRSLYLGRRHIACGHPILTVINDFVYRNRRTAWKNSTKSTYRVKHVEQFEIKTFGFLGTQLEHNNIYDWSSEETASAISEQTGLDVDQQKQLIHDLRCATTRFTDGCAIHSFEIDALYSTPGIQHGGNIEHKAEFVEPDSSFANLGDLKLSNSDRPDKTTFGPITQPEFGLPSFDDDVRYNHLPRTRSRTPLVILLLILVLSMFVRHSNATCIGAHAISEPIGKTPRLNSLFDMTRGMRKVHRKSAKAHKALAKTNNPNNKDEKHKIVKHEEKKSIDKIGDALSFASRYVKHDAITSPLPRSLIRPSRVEPRPEVNNRNLVRTINLRASDQASKRLDAPEHLSDSAHAASVSLAKGFKNKTAKFGLSKIRVMTPRGTQSLSATTITMSEYLCDVVSPKYVGEAYKYVCKSFPINPGNSSTFQYLSQIARVFDQFAILKFEAEYVTSCSTSTPGRVGLSYDYDATDFAPPSDVQFQDTGNAKIFPPWGGNLRCSTHLDRKKCQQDTYFVDDANSTPEPDPRLNVPAVLNVMTSASSESAVWGEIRLHYTIAFFAPRVDQSFPFSCWDWNPVSSGMAPMINTYPTNLATALTQTTPQYGERVPIVSFTPTSGTFYFNSPYTTLTAPDSTKTYRNVPGVFQLSFYCLYSPGTTTVSGYSCQHGNTGITQDITNGTDVAIYASGSVGAIMFITTWYADAGTYATPPKLGFSSFVADANATVRVTCTRLSNAFVGETFLAADDGKDFAYKRVPHLAYNKTPASAKTLDVPLDVKMPLVKTSVKVNCNDTDDEFVDLADKKQDYKAPLIVPSNVPPRARVVYSASSTVK